jgi:hypothetical protein
MQSALKQKPPMFFVLQRMAIIGIGLKIKTKM